MLLHRAAGVSLIAFSVPLLALSAPVVSHALFADTGTGNVVAAGSPVPTLPPLPPSGGTITPTPVGGVPTPTIVPPASSGPRQLTADEVQRVRQIATADPQLPQYAQGQSFSVQRVVDWFDSDETQQEIGGALLVAFPKPVHIDAGLPGTEPARPDGSTHGRPYRKVSSSNAVDNVSSLWLFVDLTTNEVVRVVPGPGVHVLYPPGQKPLSATNGD